MPALAFTGPRNRVDTFQGFTCGQRRSASWTYRQRLLKNLVASPLGPSKTPKGSPGPALPKYLTKREAVLCGLVGGDKPIYFLGPFSLKRWAMGELLSSEDLVAM